MRAHGTIGGGELEFQALDIARGMLRGRAASVRRDGFPLGATLGQICGGAANLAFERVPSGARVGAHARRVARERHALRGGDADRGARRRASPRERRGDLGHARRRRSRRAGDADAARRLLAGSDAAPRALPIGDGAIAAFEPLRPVDFNVVLFGAGHVGRAIARVLGVAPCDVRWIDGRAHEFPANVPANVRTVVTDAAVAEAAGAPAGSYFLVMTHSHALDFELVETILRRGDFATAA